ncbi:MAG: hypothetical protein ACRERV_10175 [Methylococcales bacterium]
MSLYERLNQFPKPDGRPLYAYKCSHENYDGIKDQLRANIDLALTGDIPLNSERG